MKNNYFKLGFRLLLALQLLSMFDTAAAQQAPLRSINYRLSMPLPATHLFEVKVEVELPEQATPPSLDFQMPRWSPGRYAVFDFAKNVQEVYAGSGICPPKQDAVNQPVCRPGTLPLSRIDNQTWRVETKGNSAITFTYKVFGNDLSGTFSQLDTRHANFNGHSIFMYIVDHKADPVRR